MANRIGPTFSDELRAADCNNGVSWDPVSGALTFTWPLDANGNPVVNTAYQAQVEAVLAAHDPTKPAIPTSVTRLQGRLQLSAAGLLAQAETAIAAAGGTMAIWYSDAQTWLRQDPHVLEMATALNLTSAQVDALFLAASAL